MSVAAAIAAHRSAVAADEALFNDDGDLLVSPAEVDASEAANNTAFRALLATPCVSIEDVQAKVDYILNGTVGERTPIHIDLTGFGDGAGDIDAEDGNLMTFLRSLMQPPPHPDPFVERLALLERDLAAYDASDDDGLEPGGTFCNEIRSGNLAISSGEGAVLALQRVMGLDCIIDTEGDVLVEAVIAFLRNRSI